MKLPPEREWEFNPPLEMLTRAIVLLTHVALAAGIVCTAAGLLIPHGQMAVIGLILLGGAWGGRVWQRNQDPLLLSDRALSALTRNTPPLDDARVAELIDLLEQWEALEQRRGSPEFDPWAVQALRHDIRVMVESDPALEQLYTTLQRAA